MTIPTLPTWTDQEVQSAGKLNLLTAALEAKFAGSIGGADLAWPLTAQGNIDMNGYDLLGLKKFWNVFNVDEYDDIQAAIDAAEAAGGSGVFVPPNNTNNDAEGLTCSGTVHIFGAGKRSIISLTSGATAGELLATTTSPSDLGFSNLVIDGATKTGSGQNGIVLKNVDGCIFDRVIFQNFSGHALVLNNEGTAGNQCSNIVLMGCRFSGGTGDHIIGNDIEGLNITNCQFLDPGSDAIVLTPDGTASYMRGIVIESCRFTSVARAIYVVGASGTANELWRQVQIHDNQVYTASAVSITVGAASAVLKWVSVKNNTMISTTGGLLVQADGGEVCGNYAPTTNGVGLDMTDSQELVVEDNRFPDAVGIPIQSTNSDDCRVHRNDVHGGGNGDEPIVKDGTTGNSYEYNHGDEYGVGGKQYVDGQGAIGAGTTSGTFTGGLFTIPANSVKAGDRLRLRAAIARSGSAAVATITLLCDNVSVGGGQIEDTDGTSIWTWELMVIATTDDTNANMFMVSELAANVQDNQQTSTGAALAIDWTTDILIDMDWAKNTADTIDQIHLTYEIF